MNDGYIAQDDRRREAGRERGREGVHMQYRLQDRVSEIYSYCKTGEVQGKSGIIKLCTLRVALFCQQCSNCCVHSTPISCQYLGSFQSSPVNLLILYHPLLCRKCEKSGVKVPAHSITLISFRSC